MTKRGPYAKGSAARDRLFRAAAAAAADPAGRLDLASLSAAAELTTGSTLYHFSNRDTVLVAAATLAADDDAFTSAERTALHREVIRIACDRRSRAQHEAIHHLPAVVGSHANRQEQRLGSLLLIVLEGSSGDEDGS